MPGFNNKEELLSLLLEDTQTIIEDIVKEIALGEGTLDTLRIKTELENLYNRIEKYKHE
jgi:hypothetical protein